MHGAIIAAAYGRPFAFWSAGSVDLPTKWRDTADLLNRPYVLCTAIDDAEAYHAKKVVPNYRRPPAWQLLSRAPFPLKPDALLKVLNYELRINGAGDEKVEEFLRLFTEQSDHFDLLAASIKDRGARQHAVLKREVVRARDEAERAMEDANVHRSRAADLDAALAAARAEAADLDLRLAAEAERSKRFAADAAALAAEVERARGDVNVHRSIAADLDAALAAARKEAADLDGRLEVAAVRSERMAAEAVALAAVVEHAKGDANVHRAKAAKLDADLATARVEAERFERMAAEAAALAAEIRAGAARTETLASVKLRIFEAEKQELLTQVGDLSRKVAERTARSTTLRLGKALGLLKRHNHDRMLQDAHAIDTFLAAVEWSRIGAPHPEGRLDRVIAHLANPNVSLPDLPFFETSLYLTQYPDVASGKIQPLVHYVTHGRKELRNIHPLFDASYYVGRYPDVAALGLSPIEHYVQIGFEKGYDPHPLFATRWYLRTYHEVARSRFNPVADYLRSPFRQPHPLFDSEYYATIYPDVVASGMNPLVHFILFGAKEGRNPNAFFDTAYYFVHNPDIAETGVNPLVHYIEHGASELRDPHPDFSTNYYLSAYPDVAASGINPLVHYLTVGRGEKRSPKLQAAHSEESPRRDAVLMIDAMYPRPNEDSGSLDQIAYIKIFRALGYEVYFASAIEFGAASGPEVAVEEAGAVCIRPPIYASIDHFMEERGGELAICFLSRAHFGGQIKDAARMYAPQSRIVFNTVDLHHIREKRQAEATGDVELLKQAEESRTLELDLAKTADATIVVSHQEKELLARELPNTRITMIPLVREYGVTSIAPFSSREGVGFIGGFRHKPNLDAVDYLLEEVWPAVLARNPSLKLYIIGSHMPAEMLDRIERNVSFVGYVPELDFWLSNLKMTVAPLRYGAGAKGKVVTSLSHGVPCVATPIASEGMGLVDDQDILVGHTTDALAEQIVRLHASSELWEQLSAAGLALMQAEYSLDSGIDKVRGLLGVMGITPPK